MDLGGGQAEVGSDIPADHGGRLPVQANATERNSRPVGFEPGDLEGPTGLGGASLDEGAAYAVRHTLYGEGVKRQEG